MKRLLVLVSTLLLAVLPCRSAPAAVEPVTCADDGGTAAARLAMHTINEDHNHGYKFKLDKIRTSRVEQVKGGCEIELMLDLQETECHVVDTKHFEDCNVRDMSDTMVTAACNVSVTVKGSGEAPNVTKYACDTKRALTQEELVKTCPDCPMLLPLNHAEGLKSVRKGLTLVNQNVTNPRYFILMEVGRMSQGYIMSFGMHYYAEFALVESHCPMGTRIVIEACVPLCPDRARHAICQSTYTISTGEQSVECEFYPPENTTAVDLEPKCGRPHRRPPPMARPGPPPFDNEQHPGPPPRKAVPPPHGGGPPPHVYPHGHGSSPYAGGPPPHAGGPPHPHHPIGHPPPPHAGSPYASPFHPPCFMTHMTFTTPGIHPICPRQATQ